MAPLRLTTFHEVIHQLLTAEGVFLVVDRKYVCCSQARFALGKEKCIHKWLSKAGVTAFWASLRFGHPHSQIPSVLGIPFSYYCSVLGIPRYPPGMPKSLAFWSSPPKNAGFRGKIENVLDMASAKYRDLFQYLKKKASREVLYKAKKKFAKKFEYDSKLESLFYVAKKRFDDLLSAKVFEEIHCSFFWTRRPG